MPFPPTRAPAHCRRSSRSDHRPLVVVAQALRAGAAVRTVPVTRVTRNAWRRCDAFRRQQDQRRTRHLVAWRDPCPEASGKGLAARRPRRSSMRPVGRPRRRGPRRRVGVVVGGAGVRGGQEASELNTSGRAVIPVSSRRAGPARISSRTVSATTAAISPASERIWASWRPENQTRSTRKCPSSYYCAS